MYLFYTDFLYRPLILILLKTLISWRDRKVLKKRNKYFKGSNNTVLFLASITHGRERERERVRKRKKWSYAIIYRDIPSK